MSSRLQVVNVRFDDFFVIYYGLNEKYGTLGQYATCSSQDLPELRENKYRNAVYQRVPRFKDMFEDYFFMQCYDFEDWFVFGDGDIAIEFDDIQKAIARAKLSNSEYEFMYDDYVFHELAVQEIEKPTYLINKRIYSTICDKETPNLYVINACKRFQFSGKDIKRFSLQDISAISGNFLSSATVYDGKFMTIRQMFYEFLDYEKNRIVAVYKNGEKVNIITGKSLSFNKFEIDLKDKKINPIAIRGTLQLEDLKEVIEEQKEIYFCDVNCIKMWGEMKKNGT